MENVLSVDTLIYTAQIPEYPKSSMNGIAYIIPVEALDADEVKRPWNSVSLFETPILYSGLIRNRFRFNIAFLVNTLLR